MSRHAAFKTISADHPAFPDHFPGDPTLPGAVIAELVVEIARENGWRVIAIEALKFIKPIRSGGALHVVLERNGASARFDCSMSDTLVASGKLRLKE